MNKVTINPSEKIISKADEEVAVTDSLGRTIIIRTPDVWDQYLLVEFLGENAKNDVYRAMCIPIMYVTSIDGEQVFKPASKKELQALVQRLGEVGISAVMKGIRENFNQSEEEVEEEIKK